jgi:hypothetical protein
MTPDEQRRCAGVAVERSTAASTAPQGQSPMNPSSDRNPSEQPLSTHAAERVAHAMAAAEVSDYTAAIVPTASDNLAQPGEFITQARQARKLALALLLRAVLLERALGHSWAQIAASYGYDEEWVRARYEPLEREWLTKVRGGHAPSIENIDTALLMMPLKDVPVSDHDIRAVAAQLDDWCERRREWDTFPDASTRPVTDGLVTS